MKIYLAHNFAARDWLRVKVIPFFTNAGHEITSRWITDDQHLATDYKKESAIADFEDIEMADVLIYFAKNYGDRLGQGKYVELGYAIALRKLVIVVGYGTCVFYHHPCIKQVSVYAQAINYLGVK